MLGFLKDLMQSQTVSIAAGRTYEQQYEWLCPRLDPASDLERQFLDCLVQMRRRLPDFAQYCPTPDVPVQVDFYLERAGIPGICVFIDGPAHDQLQQAKEDRVRRAALEELGYRVVTVTYGKDLRQQIEDYPDVFRSEGN